MLSFRAPFLDFFPLPFPLAENDTLIAPFWNDYDVTQGGDILFRFSNDEALLSAVGSSINDAFLSNFSPQVLFIATWDGVPLLTSAGVCEIIICMSLYFPAGLGGGGGGGSLGGGTTFCPLIIGSMHNTSAPPLFDAASCNQQVHLPAGH